MTLLIDEVASLKQLKTAWHHVRKNGAVTPGIDEVTIEDFEISAEISLRELSKQLKKGSYTFTAALRVKIPKTKNKTRDINIFILKDRIVQKSIQLSFEKKRKRNELFPQMRNKVSIGFLKKESNLDKYGIPGAVSRVKENFKNGFYVMTVADIEDFFTNIDLQKLKKIIYSHLPDESLNYLIDQCLSPDILDSDRYGKQNYKSIVASGVAQGSILSPMFSNIYLMDFDKKIEAFKIPAIRYADDFAFFSKNQIMAEQELMKISTELWEFSKLKFHPKGSKKGPKHFPLKTGCFYLGLRMQYLKQRWEISPSEEKIKLVKFKIEEVLRFSADYSLTQRINFLNRSISSWYKTYENNGCTKRILHGIFEELRRYYIENLQKLLIHKGFAVNKLQKGQIEFLGILTRRSQLNSIKRDLLNRSVSLTENNLHE